ncbi:MAG TPA: hypothetical protein VNU68_19135 [Verrucomicrobiae bacterium]|nr:hypothetical protein [Verrucomicrobiae bacterium]
MPCHTRITMEVKLEKMNPELLMAALTGLKLGPVLQGNVIRFGRGESYDIATGKAQLGQRYTVNEIKQAYSVEVVKSQAKKFGWQLTETGPLQYTVIKR